MRQSTRISLLSLHYPPESTGNAPYAGGLARGLADRGMTVVAHVGHPHYPEWAIREGYGQWRSVEQLDGVHLIRRRHYVPRRPRGLRRLISELSFGCRVVLARWGGPDVVIATSPALFATALALMKARLSWRHVPVIVWVQDLYSIGMEETGEGSGLSTKVARWVEGRTLRSADRVVVIHDRFAQIAHERLGVDLCRIEVVRNWTHLLPHEPLDRLESRRALGWPTDQILAVHTGNMGAKQGLDNVVEAARLADLRRSNVRFLLVGDGNDRRRLEAIAQGVSRLTFVDPLDDADYVRALSAADILLVNEKAGVSAMAVPSKLTSYFDAGRPVIAATDPDGITASEILAADAGVVVPAGDPAKLLDSILAVGTNRELGDRFGSNGRAYRLSVLGPESALTAFTKVIQSVRLANPLLRNKG